MKDESLFFFFQTRDILKQSMELPSSLKAELSSLTQAPGWEMRHCLHSSQSGQDCSQACLCMMQSPREVFAVSMGSQPAPLCCGVFAEEVLGRARSRSGAVPALQCQQSSTSSGHRCRSACPAACTCWDSTNQLGWGSSGKQTPWVSILRSLNPKLSKPFLLPKQLSLTPCQFVN